MLFEPVCYQFFCKQSTLFRTKTRFSNEFSQHYWLESIDGDSFASQSRLDVYAILNKLAITICIKAYKWDMKQKIRDESVEEHYQ